MTDKTFKCCEITGEARGVYIKEEHVEETEERVPGPEMGLEIRDLLGNIPGIYILHVVTLT